MCSHQRRTPGQAVLQLHAVGQVIEREGFVGQPVDLQPAHVGVELLQAPDPVPEGRRLQQGRRTGGPFAVIGRFARLELRREVGSKGCQEAVAAQERVARQALFAGIDHLPVAHLPLQRLVQVGAPGHAETIG